MNNPINPLPELPPLPEAELFEPSCIYNDGVGCMLRSPCGSCGWNPSVTVMRLKNASHARSDAKGDVRERSA